MPGVGGGGFNNTVAEKIDPAYAAYKANIRPGDVIYNGSARDTNAALTQSQWADYKNRFQPLETQLQGNLTYNPVTGAQNTQMIADNLGRANTAVSNSFDTEHAAQQRDLGRMGITPDAGQMSSIQRATAISKAASTVDAENMTRTRLADRNQEIALGSVPSSGRAY